ncbi:MAG TPA: FlgD immunoglobulin-like domain containing protein, partial [Bacillota bacterium]|nr:FlgD immunoglobulin-like domain containing protein [Bacillota bacterium]
IIYSKGLTQAQSGEAVLTWEGQTQSGDMAPEAQYEFSLTVTPQGQLGQKFFGTIVVDSTPPEPVRPVLPVPGAEITNTKPELRWEGFADLYQVIYGQQEDLSDGILVTTSEPQLQITEALAPGRWYWQVLGIDLAGNVSRNNAVSTFVINSLDTTEMDLPFLQVGPNPFSPGEDGRRDELVVSYTLTRPAEVKIEVFNLAGRLIAYREALLHDPGDHIWFWNGTDSSGGLVKTGLYLLKITIKDNETLEVGERMQPIMVIR